MTTAYRTPETRVLVVAFNDVVRGLDETTGAVVWRAALPAFARPIAIEVTGDRVYAAAGGAAPVCLDLATGAVLWSAHLATHGRATLLLDGDALYVATAGEVECYGIDGQRRWHNGFPGEGIGEVAIGVPGRVAQGDERG